MIQLFSATCWANSPEGLSGIKLDSVSIVCDIWPHVSLILYLGICRILSWVLESPLSKKKINKKSLQSFWHFHLKNIGYLFFYALDNTPFVHSKKIGKSFYWMNYRYKCVHNRMLVSFMLLLVYSFMPHINSIHFSTPWMSFAIFRLLFLDCMTAVHVSGVIFFSIETCITLFICWLFRF